LYEIEFYVFCHILIWTLVSLRNVIASAKAIDTKVGSESQSAPNALLSSPPLEVLRLWLIAYTHSHIGKLSEYPTKAKAKLKAPRIHRRGDTKAQEYYLRDRCSGLHGKPHA